MKSIGSEERGAVPEEVKIVYKISVVESANGVEPGVHVTGATEALIAPILCWEGAGEKHGNPVNDPRLQDVEDFFKVSFGQLRACVWHIVCAYVNDNPVDGGGHRLEKVREHLHNTGHCGTGETVCDGVEKPNISDDGVTNYDCRWREKRLRRGVRG